MPDEMKNAVHCHKRLNYALKILQRSKMNRNLLRPQHLRDHEADPPRNRSPILDSLLDLATQRLKSLAVRRAEALEKVGVDQGRAKDLGWGVVGKIWCFVSEGVWTGGKGSSPQNRKSCGVAKMISRPFRRKTINWKGTSQEA